VTTPSMAKLRERRRAAGLCRDCGALVQAEQRRVLRASREHRGLPPMGAVGGSRVFCSDCLAYHRERERARYQARRERSLDALSA